MKFQDFQDFAKAMLIAQIFANSSEKSSEKEPTDLNENNVSKENEMNIESNQNTDEFYNPLELEIIRKDEMI